MPADVFNLQALPVGLGLLGFIEPCSIGSNLLFIGYVEGKDPAVKIAQAGVFALTRAAFTGALGAAAALVGAAFRRRAGSCSASSTSRSASSISGVRRGR